MHRQAFVLPDGHPLSDGYDVVACDRCGFVYADTVVTQEAYERFYADSSKYADLQTGTGGGDLAWDDRRLEETAREIARHLPDRGARVVDVGCANGGLLKWLSRLGYGTLIGVDPAAACVRAVERFPGVTGLVGSLFDLPVGAREADCLVLSHVLEHVRELPEAMARVFAATRPGGLLYVEVPDATRYAECLAAPLQDFNTEHINHFSLRSLRTLLERSGYVVRDEGQKTIEASAGVPYPALWIVAERAEAAVGVPAAPPHDGALRTALERYIELSLAQVARIDAHLARELQGVDALVVWGVGQTTLKLLAVTMLARANVVAFVDTNPMLHGKRLRGAPIVGTDELALLPHPVLVGSLISREPIARRIRELGLANRVIFLEP
jgi:SAM-dependent methyltransferase